MGCLKNVPLKIHPPMRTALNASGVLKLLRGHRSFCKAQASENEHLQKFTEMISVSLQLEQKAGFQNPEQNSLTFGEMLTSTLEELQNCLPQSWVKREIKDLMKDGSMYALYETSERMKYIERVQNLLNGMAGPRLQVNSSPVPSSVPVNLHAGERVMTHPPYSENVAQSQDRGSAYVQPQHNGTAQKQRKLDIHMRNKKVLGPLSGRQTVNRPHTKTSPIDYSPQNGLQKPRLAESRQTWNVPSPQSVNQGTLPKTPKNLDHAAVQESRLLRERRESGSHASSSGSFDSGPSLETHCRDFASTSINPPLTGSREYKLVSRDPRGPRSGYDSVHLQLHKGWESDKYKFIAFDTETTGNSLQIPGYGKDGKPRSLFNRQKIVEIAAHALESGEGMQTLVNPGEEIHPAAQVIHQISSKDCMHPDVPGLRAACQAFLDFVHDQVKDSPGAIPVLVAHNLILFDHPVMAYNFEQVGLQWPDEWMFMDSLLYARDLRKSLKKKNKLGDLVQDYGIPIQGELHQAMTDVRCLAMLIPHLIEDLQSGDVDSFLKQHIQAASDGQAAGSMKLLKDKAELKKQINQRNYVKNKAASNWKKENARKAAVALPTDSDPIRKFERSAKRQAVAFSPEIERLRGEDTKAKDIIPEMTSDWLSIMESCPFHRVLLDDEITADSKTRITTLQAGNLKDPKLDMDIFADILEQYPRDYQNCSLTMEDGQYATILGTIAKNSSSASFKFQRTVLTVHVDPEASRCKLDEFYEESPSEQGTQIVKFERMTPMMHFGSRKTLTHNARASEGSQIIMQGRLTELSPGHWQMDQNANLIYDWEKQDGTPQLILPVYSKRQKVDVKDWKSVITKVLRYIDAKGKNLNQSYWDPLPPSIAASPQYQFMPWLEAVKQMHLPSSEADLDEARRRLAFDDLFFPQLMMLLRRSLIRQEDLRVNKRRSTISNHTLARLATKDLPYKLTRAQETVLEEIFEDMASDHPMLRLLQGDVGCGKTIVAFLALLAANGSGFQGAIMAPTEVLVEQHYSRLTEIINRLPGNVRPKIAKLSGTNARPGKPRKDILEGLKNGDIDLVVGTKALASDVVVFKNLGLAVIDEQHKFGVDQRAKLQGKASPLPHVMYMTATPIPRTLALVSHGDMTFSAIDELPAGRQKVETHVIEDTEKETDKMYEEVRKEIQAGGRVFIILCFINESKAEAMEEVKAATIEYEKLLSSQKLGKDTKIGLLHGSLKSEEKEAAMRDFVEGKTQALVSTTLVEVGVDVREASVMIINNAERFGLAQLHQLRGRVGRGLRKSKCFLLNADMGSEGKNSQRRLSLMATEHNGLRLAEADLVTRGQGDVMGKQQSGKDIFASMKVAKIPEDAAMMNEARETAAELIYIKGLDPRNWPPELLVALAKRKGPKLEHDLVSR